MFHTLNQNHNYNTGAANNYQLDFPPTGTTHYETYSFRKKAVEAWNEIPRMSIPDQLKLPVDFRKEMLRLCYSNIVSNILTKYLRKTFMLSS